MHRRQAGANGKDARPIPLSSFVRRAGPAWCFARHFSRRKFFSRGSIR